MRSGLFQSGQIHHLEHFGDPRPRLLLVPQTEGDVPCDVEVREERAFLRDDADPTSLGWKPRSLVGCDRSCDRDGARRRAEVPGDSAKQCGLSGATGTQNGDELLLLDLYRDIPHDDGSAVSDRDVVQRQLRHCRRRCHRTPPT